MVYHLTVCTCSQTSWGHSLGPYQSLRCRIDLSLGRLPDLSWKWCPDRPWTDGLINYAETTVHHLLTSRDEPSHVNTRMWHYNPQWLYANNEEDLVMQSVTPTVSTVQWLLLSQCFWPRLLFWIFNRWWCCMLSFSVVVGWVTLLAEHPA